MTHYLFKTIVEVDLGRDDIIYLGRSAASAIQASATADKMIRLFDKTAVVKIQRCLKPKGKSLPLSKTIYENGIKVRHNEFFAPKTWYDDEMEKPKEHVCAVATASMNDSTT